MKKYAIIKKENYYTKKIIRKYNSWYEAFNYLKSIGQESSALYNNRLYEIEEVEE